MPVAYGGGNDAAIKPLINRGIRRAIKLTSPRYAIGRREVEARFILLSSKHGWAIGNQVISLLRSVWKVGAPRSARPTIPRREPDRRLSSIDLLVG